MTRRSGRRILIAIPAHNEEQRLEACLRSATAAVASAVAEGVVARAVVAVAAHRCTDGTEAIARSVLGPGHLVVRLDAPASVGAVRAELVRRAVEFAGEPDWLLSTDADSRVPDRWIADVLRLGAGHDAIAGLVELSELSVDSPIAAAHLELVRAGIHPDGTHRHVYAANLAIRWPVYRAAGGFPDVPHGEEVALIDAVRRIGGRVLTTTELRVVTSGRLRGRAAHGLADLLSDLVQQSNAAGLR